MADSWTASHIHLVWSTSYRDSMLRPGHHRMLTETFAATCAAHGVGHLLNGGAADHVHLLIEIRGQTAIPTLVDELKAASAKRLRGPLGMPSFFQWQTGYAAFSVQEGSIERVERFIELQDLLHRTVAYEEELRRIFAECDLGYDISRFIDSRNDAVVSG